MPTFIVPNDEVKARLIKNVPKMTTDVITTPFHKFKVQWEFEYSRPSIVYTVLSIPNNLEEMENLLREQDIAISVLENLGIKHAIVIPGTVSFQVPTFYRNICVFNLRDDIQEVMGSLNLQENFMKHFLSTPELSNYDRTYMFLMHVEECTHCVSVNIPFSKIFENLQKGLRSELRVVVLEQKLKSLESEIIPQLNAQIAELKAEDANAQIKISNTNNLKSNSERIPIIDRPCIDGTQKVPRTLPIPFITMEDVDNRVYESYKNFKQISCLYQKLKKTLIAFELKTEISSTAVEFFALRGWKNFNPNCIIDIYALSSIDTTREFSEQVKSMMAQVSIANTVLEQVREFAKVSNPSIINVYRYFHYYMSGIIIQDSF